MARTSGVIFRVFDVACVGELVGVNSDVAMVMVCDHGNMWVPVFGVLWVSGIEVMVDSVEERGSIEGSGVDGVFAMCQKVSGELLGACCEVHCMYGTEIWGIREGILCWGGHGSDDLGLHRVM